MDVCYLAANRYHMSVIRQTKQGMVIQPLDHMLLELNLKQTLDEVTEIYDVCQDDKHFLHIIYVNQNHRMMHVILDSQKYVLKKLDLHWDATGVHELKIQSVSNHLHVILLFGDRVVHRVLSGIHWSEPLTLVSEDQVNGIQLQGTQGLLYLGFLKKKGEHSQFCLLKHQADQAEWSDLGTVFQIEGRDPLFPLMVLDHQQQLHIVIQQFSQKFLYLYYFMLDPTKKNVQITEDKKEIPIEQVDAATFSIKEDILMLYCASNGFLYRFSYYVKANQWGTMKMMKLNTFAKWVMVTSAEYSGPIAPYFISDSHHLGNLEEQTEFGLDLYRVERDLQQSMEFADRSLSSVLSLVKQKEQLSSSQKKLSETEKEWRRKIKEIKARLIDLKEEERQICQEIEQKAAEVKHPEKEQEPQQDILYEYSDPAPNPEPDPDLNIDVQEPIQLKQTSIKEKVAHLLQKIIRNV